MVKLNKIYTKTGDEGTTGLVTGGRIKKTDVRIVAIGAVDELNASIGVALCHISKSDALHTQLSRIQNDLFDLGADLATPEEMEGALRLSARQANWLEDKIDELNEALPALTSFILPAGTPAAAHLHQARAIARRAEVTIWGLMEAVPANEIVSPTIPVFLNRLSDYLFVAARKAALADCGEVLWEPGKNLA